MNLHEFQGKSILKQYGVTVPEGIVAFTADEAVSAAKMLTEKTGTNWWVVKAQIHAGGRGKGGGVKLAKSLDEVSDLSKKILGMMLVTPQTKSEGKKVNKVLIQQDVYYPGPTPTSEFYMSVMLDRAMAQNMILYSPRGGMDIEAVAEETPDQIFKEYIDPKTGLQAFQCRRIAFNLGLTGDAWKAMLGFVNSLYNAFVAIDASLFEINPVLKTSDNKILAVDCKVVVDNNALYRHPEIANMLDGKGRNFASRMVLIDSGTPIVQQAFFDSLAVRSESMNIASASLLTKNSDWPSSAVSELGLRLGLRLIPVAEIGLYADRTRAHWPVMTQPVAVPDWRQNSK